MIYGGLPQIVHLTDAFLISKASRYDIKGRKYIGANLLVLKKQIQV